MKNNKKADTIAGIIIAVFILSFALLGIVNVLDYNKDISYNYEKETNEYILKSNSENILKAVDTSNIEEDEKFYIYKDESIKEYVIYTGSTNEEYKYIDKDGNKVTPDGYTDKVYTREYEMKIDILRYDINPPEIDDLVFWFDATNIDGDNNSTLSDGDEISVWYDQGDENGQQNAVDKSTMPTTANYTSELPVYKEDEINGLPVVSFNGTDQQLAMDTHEDINGNYFDCSKDKVLQYEKSFAIVFKTGSDIENTQIVYEQGGGATGYNFTIENGDLWAGIHNKALSSSCNTARGTTFGARDSGHKFKSVNLGEILPYTVYFVTVIQDSSHFDDYGNPIDDENTLRIYLNGYLASEATHVDPQEEHLYGGLGNIYYGNVSGYSENTLRDVGGGGYDKAFFEGGIGELISRNHVLSPNEIRGVQNYFYQKWMGYTKSVEYDVVNTEIERYENF